jgi:hypothetical protein
LLADATFCPYCERWLDEPAARPGAAPTTRIRRLVGERTILALSLVSCAVVAVICVLVALFV